MTKARKTEARLFFNISVTIVTNRLWSVPVIMYLVGIFSVANQEPLSLTIHLSLLQSLRTALRPF